MMGCRLRVDNAFKQGITGHTVSAVQAGTRGFSYSIQSSDVSEAVVVHQNAAAGVMGRGDHGYGFGANVDTKF